MKVVLTAFEPFGGRSINRSAQLLERVRPLPGITVEKALLPVAFAALPAAVDAVFARGPDAVVLMGEANRKVISVECVAQNRIDARIPDNAGARPKDEPVIADAPGALYVSWDAAAVRDAIDAAGVAVELSDDAGSYACNAALYLALNRARCPAGFLHVPASRWPFGPRLARLARAVEAVLGAIATAPG